MINLLCIFLTLYQLKRLYRDFTTKNLAAVRIAALCTSLLNIQYQVTFSTPTTKLGKDKIFIIISIVKRMEARRES